MATVKRDAKICGLESNVLTTVTLDASIAVSITPRHVDSVRTIGMVTAVKRIAAQNVNQTIQARHATKRMASVHLDATMEYGVRPVSKAAGVVVLEGVAK